jgi:SET domain-containing protein
MSPATKREREGGMMHLNHSCEPNLGLQGQVVYLALRDIEADEELTFDYAMNDDEPDEMPVWNTKLPRHDHRPRLAQARGPEQV